jgi:hypothetical protein
MAEDERTVSTAGTAEGSAEGADGDALRLSALLSDAPSPLPCDDGELSAVDFTRLDVLIGTLRSDWQFDYCMESNTYYIPAGTVTPADLLPSVIALYEEGLNRRAGIKRYGRVTDTRVVKRCDIPVPMSRPNPEEAYYLFTVEGWSYLEHPIALQGTARGKPMFTCEFLLTHCRRSYQLLAIRSPEAYRLCRLLCRLAEEDTASPVFRRVGEHHIITVTDGRLRLLNASGGCLYACPAGRLTHSPAEVLRGVVKALGVRNG